MTVNDIKDMTLKDLISLGDFTCSCGKVHSPGVAKVIIEKGAVNTLPALLEEIGAKKPFLLSGHDTFAAAGEVVCSVLKKSGYSYAKYVFPVLFLCKICVSGVSCSADRVHGGFCTDAF